MATNNNNSISDINFTSQRLPSAQTASIWLSAFSVLGFLIVVVNMLTIAAIFLNTRLRMYCIVNLAIADLLRGIFSTAHQIYDFINYISDANDFHSDVLHDLTMTAAIFAVYLSLLSLVLIAIERVFAAFSPIRYRNITLKYYLVALAIIWCLAMLATLLSYLQHHVIKNEPALDTFAHLVIRSMLILSLVLIIGSYTAVYIKMDYQDKAQRQHQLPGVVMQRARKERHLAKTLFIVTAVSLTAWIPYATVRFIYSFLIPFIDLFKIIPNIISATLFINLANSLINPVIYVFRIKDIRKAMFSLVCSRSRCARKVDPMSASTSNNNQPTSLPTNAIAITPRVF